MPIAFEVPEPWNDRGWRVKIQDRERLEPPHVTVLYKTRKWRFGLRELQFLDVDPPTREVPSELVRHLEANSTTYASAWDEMYPHNPVASQDV